MLIAAAAFIVRQGWVQVDWPSIERDLQLDMPQRIQEKSKNKAIEKALPGGLSTYN